MDISTIQTIVTATLPDENGSYHQVSDENVAMFTAVCSPALVDSLLQYIYTLENMLAETARTGSFDLNSFIQEVKNTIENPVSKEKLN